jgi:uncharacterized Zn finger protein
MAGTLQVLATWSEALERHLLRAILGVDPSRVRIPRSLEVRLVWEKGRVRGTVEAPGGRFLVTLRVKPLADRAWKWAHQALLAGRFDPAVVEAFEEAGASLFVGGTRRVECTCKGERDCRHRLALVAQMVAEAAENPFLWLAVLGREREAFLATLRVALMEELPEGEEGALDRERFWAVPRAVRATGAGATAGEVPVAGAPNQLAAQAESPVPTLVEKLGSFPLVDGPLLVANRGGRSAIANYRSLTEFLQLYARQVAEGAKALQTDALEIPEPPPPPSPASTPVRSTRKRRSRRRYR